MADREGGFEDTDRLRGFLTKTDRQYLTGQADEDLSMQAEHQRRYRVRKRILSALQDFRYLPLLSPQDLNQLYDRIERSSDSNESHHIEEGIHELLSLLYLGLGPDAFSSVLVASIRDAIIAEAAERGQYLDPEVKFSVEQREHSRLDELAQQYGEDPDTVSVRHLLALMYGGYISYEEYLEQLEFKSD